MTGLDGFLHQLAAIFAVADGGHRLGPLGNGNGLAASPFLIATPQDLATFRNRVNRGEPHLCARLTADIDLSHHHHKGQAHPWIPIGTCTDAYRGTFDGNGHRITSLCLDYETPGHALFGYAHGATLRRLEVEGTVCSYRTDYAAVIVGTAIHCTIEDCVSRGFVSGQWYAGGIAANAFGSVIRHCTNHATVLSQGSLAGGIVGNHAAIVTGCASVATILNNGTTEGTSVFGTDIGQLTDCHILADDGYTDTTAWPCATEQQPLFPPNTQQYNNILR